MRVLLVEDDPMIGAAIEAALKDVGYATDWVRDGLAACTAAASHAYAVVLLDLGLPKRDGMAVLDTLRRSGNEAGVLLVTARDALHERVHGLDSGADDYVQKPFEMAELLARMRAVLRRKGGQAAPLLGNGVLTLDPATRLASNATGMVQLTAREFSLLHALLLRPGAILSRSELEDRIYGWGEEVESNAVEYLIHALRKKLGPQSIRNVRGVGWMVSRPV